MGIINRDFEDILATNESKDTSDKLVDWRSQDSPSRRQASSSRTDGKSNDINLKNFDNQKGAKAF
jgi:hypothetical protein